MLYKVAENHRNLLNIFALWLLFIPSFAFSGSASPASFFDDAFLRKEIEEGLTPGLGIKSISFATKSEGFLDELQAAGFRDAEDLIEQVVSNSRIPRHTKAFLVDKIRNMDVYGSLVSLCLLRRHHCNKNLFTLLVKTEEGRGFKEMTYQCETELVVQEPKRRVLRANIEGDIQLVISNCTIPATDGLAFGILRTTRPRSLAAIRRSGYESDSMLKVSLNEQVDFLTDVEAYMSHAGRGGVATGDAKVGNADGYADSSESPSPILVEPDLVERSRSSRNKARYCRVLKNKIEYSCILTAPTEPNLACQCEVTDDTKGRTQM